MFERIPGKSVAPQVVRLGRGISLAPGETIELDCPRASILNVAFRIQTSGPVNVAVEEQQDDGWQRTETLEAAEGETVWHHILKKPVFRLCLTNPAGAGESVTVSVDANLPCRV